MCHTPSRHDPPAFGRRLADLRGMSFKEPIPALSNVMDTNEHASPNAGVEPAKDVAIGLV